MALLTKYVDHTIGSTGGNGDVGDQWKYIWEATAAMAADRVGGAGTATTNQWLIWVKASATYGTDGTSPNPSESDDADHDGAGGDAGAVLFLDSTGTATLPNVFECYHTTIGDGGIVKIDCQYDSGPDNLTNGIRTGINGSVYVVFKNFFITRASGNGFDGNSSSDDHILCKNCCAYLNGGVGFSLDNFSMWICCLSEQNAGDGFNIDTNHFCFACNSINNGGMGFNNSSGTIYNSLAYNNASHDFRMSSTTAIALVLGCTSDCEGAANDYCVKQDQAASHFMAVVNCILHDGDYGIYSDVDCGEIATSRHNLFNLSGTADVNNWLATSTGDGTGNRGDVVDPGGQLFENEGARDYSPHDTSGAKDVAIDAYFTQQFWADYNKGAGDNPPSE